jgi:hypothetical protein
MALNRNRTCGDTTFDTPPRSTALYQRRKGTDQELVEFERVKSRPYRLAGWGLARVLLRVNRRGLFFVRVFFRDDNGPFGHRGVVDRAVQ